MESRSMRVDGNEAIPGVAGRTDRIDESHLLLPPHFNRHDSSACFRFLDQMAEVLSGPHSADGFLEQHFRHLYAVLQIQRRRLQGEAWNQLAVQCREHPVAALLYEDALTRRAFAKPRGYAGDAELLDMMYGTEHGWPAPEMSARGHAIHATTSRSSACMGVRSRRAIISEYLDQLAMRRRAAHVMSLACGHLREAEISASIIRRQFDRFLAIDNDPISLESVERDYSRYGVEAVLANARETLSGRVNHSDFDLIYTSGLCDYLNEGLGQRLAVELFDRLNPCGQLLLTNFVPDIEGVGYMEAFMDWNLVYRDRIGMMTLAERIPDRQIRQIQVFSEENHNVVFLVIEKAG